MFTAEPTGAGMVKTQTFVPLPRTGRLCSGDNMVMAEMTVGLLPCRPVAGFARGTWSVSERTVADWPYEASKIEVPSILIAMGASGLVAGPWTTEPSVMLYLLPWQGQLMVPFRTVWTMQP